MIQTKKLIPELRFKEFEGEWEEGKLGDATKYVKGFAFKSKDYQNKGIRIVRVSDLATDRIKKNNDKIYIDEKKALEFEKYKLKCGNIIITTVGSKPEMLESAVGRGIYINDENEGLLNQNMLKFENITGISNGFIIGLINSKRYQHYMKGIARGNANQANITVVDLLQYKISFPSLPEQKKIANFLAAIDKKIQQLTKKKELLEQYKKGVLQKLFSRELRFKDEKGNDFPDWVEKRLDEISEIVGGGTPETVNLDYWDGDIQWFTPTEIRSKFISNSNRTITQKGLDKSSAKLLPAGTILFTSRATIAELGFATKECSTNQGFQSIIVDQSNISEFVYQLIKVNKKEFIRKSQGSTFLEISSKEMKKINFEIPTIPEQKKIATYLSSIDKKIESITNQITQTQNFKKGLLQKMFV